MNEHVSGFRLMAVHAHPDDESSKGAATTARYAAEGHEVMVLTLTGGERGDILNPAMDVPGVRDRISEVRQEEMAEAARILGVKQRWLGFVDSGLPEGDPLPPLPEGCFALVPLEESTRALVKVIREFRPHVVTTYDENGGYPHPDHIRCHEVTMAAYEAAADPEYFPEDGEPWEIKKVYYSHGFIRKRLELFQEEYERRGEPFPMADWLKKWKTERGDMMVRVTTQVTCGDYFPQRDDALRAHATEALSTQRAVLKAALQHPGIAGSVFDSLPPETFTHPAYVVIRQAMADAGGTSKGLGGAEWIEVVTKGVEDMTVASVVSELAVEPMPCDEDTVPRYINGVLARLQEAWVGEQVADLKSKLQRVSPAAAPEEYNSLFGDLVALEQYRRQLREQAVGDQSV